MICLSLSTLSAYARHPHPLLGPSLQHVAKTILHFFLRLPSLNDFFKFIGAYDEYRRVSTGAT